MTRLVFLTSLLLCLLRSLPISHCFIIQLRMMQLSSNCRLRHLCTACLYTWTVFHVNLIQFQSWLEQNCSIFFTFLEHILLYYLHIMVTTCQVNRCSVARRCLKRAKRFQRSSFSVTHKARTHHLLSNKRALKQVSPLNRVTDTPKSDGVPAFPSRAEKNSC